jgi:AcrR family transcriptional regulator
MRRKDPAKTAAIRQQALELVVREGLDGFSMQKLARSAKVSPATLYIHFGNREKLLNDLVSEVFGQMSAALLEDFDSDLSFARGLEIQWRNRIRYFLAHPLEMRFLESVHGTAYESQARADVGGSFHSTLCAFVEGAQARGN